MGIGRWAVAGIGIAVVGAVAGYAQYRSSTEEPSYTLVKADDPFELRAYGPMIVAEVTHYGTRERTRGASFQRLAAYIFGKDRPNGGEKIAMTAPVLHEETGTNEWRMRFVMPSDYTMASLPKPPSDVTLTEMPARRMAAIRFSGNASEADLIVMEQRLKEWIEKEGLTSEGEFEYAFYDAPMVPGPLRRNEVMIAVTSE